MDETALVELQMDYLKPSRPIASSNNSPKSLLVDDFKNAHKAYGGDKRNFKH